MAASHVGRHVPRSLRLVNLLRSLGLSQEMVAGQNAKTIAASVRAEYLRRAKEQHPDLVPEEQKDAASQRFKKLHEEFSEATGLLEEGVRPHHEPFRYPAGTHAAYQGSNVRQGGYRYPVYDQADFQEGPRYPVDNRPQFDTYTRVKCNVIFWSGFFAFITFMREFLVWSAGSTYSWSRPENMNPFWIRRFKDDWGDKAAKDRVAPPEKTEGTPEQKKKAKVDEKVKELQAKTHRDTSEFYTKRRISNVKRKYSPRGMGGVQM